jgi:hypothetical protein
LSVKNESTKHAKDAVMFLVNHWLVCEFESEQTQAMAEAMADR